MRVHLHKNFITPRSRSGVFRYDDVFVRRWFVISELIGVLPRIFSYDWDKECHLLHQCVHYTGVCYIKV